MRRRWWRGTRSRGCLPARSNTPGWPVVGNQAGVRDWTDYALDLTGTPIANELNTDAYNL